MKRRVAGLAFVTIAMATATLPDWPGRGPAGLLALLMGLPILVAFAIDRELTVGGVALGMLGAIVALVATGLVASLFPQPTRGEAARLMTMAVVAAVGFGAVVRVRALVQGPEDIGGGTASNLRDRFGRIPVSIVVGATALIIAVTLALSTPDAETPYVGLAATLADGSPFPGTFRGSTGTGLPIVITITNMSDQPVVGPLVVVTGTERTSDPVRVQPGAVTQVRLSVVVQPGDSEVRIDLATTPSSHQSLVLRLNGA